MNNLSPVCANTQNAFVNAITVNWAQKVPHTANNENHGWQSHGTGRKMFRANENVKEWRNKNMSWEEKKH